MREVSRSLKLWAVEHITAKHVRVAIVVLTLTTLVISAGAPAGFGGQ